MAENTIDTLSLQIESDAKKSFQSIDRLTSSLIGLGKATDRINAKSFGNLSQNIKSFSSAVRGLKNAAIPDFSGIVNSFTRLNGATFDTSGINNVAKALKGLASVDMGKFNGTDFSQITSSIGQLVNIPDVSNSLNRFVSSLQKLANAGDKITPVANNLPILGNSLRNVVNTMAGAAMVSDSVNQFTQSIGRLASAGAKTTQTAEGLDKLAEKTKDFFAAMQNAPQVSENTIRMTQALAQLASAGGNVGKATDSISNGFNRLSGISGTLSNTVSKAATAVTKAAKKMVSAFASIGNSSKHIKTASFNLKSLLKTALGFGALRGLVNFGKEAVEFSSDLTEVQNIVDVTFGNMAYKLEDLAKTSIDSFGMSELTLKQIASRYQAMGAAMGFSQSKMSDMSIELTKLAADMASFYNVEQDAVAEDLAAIFTGQTRPLRQYGLDLTQATLAEWAMKNGLDSNIQSMSQLEKTMLRYQYVLANTGAAQGDFARTAGTWANQTRILRQNIQQLGGVIGQGLIAALLPGIKLLNTLMAGLTKVATAFRDFMYVLTGKKFEPSGGGFTTDFGDIAEDMSDTADASGGVADGLDDASDNAKKLKKNLDIADYDELRVLKKDADDLSKSLGKAGSGGIGGLGDIDSALEDAGGLEDWLKNSKIIQPINEWASRIRSAFLSKDWERLGRTVADGLNKGLKKIYDALDWKKVEPKITAFTDGITRTFNSFVDYFDWDLLGRTVGRGINTGINTLNQLIEGTDWKNLGRKFASGINGLFDEVNWTNLGNFIGNKFMIAWNIFSGFVEDLKFAKIGRSFAKLLNGAFDKIDFSEIALSITNGINGAFVSLLNFTRTFRWEDLKNNVTNGINTALSNMKWEDAGKSLNAFLLDLGNFMLGVAQDVNWEEFGRGIGDFLSQIDWGTHFKNLLGILKEVLGGIWSGIGETSAGKFIQAIAAYKIAAPLLMPFINNIVKFFAGKAVIKSLSGGIQGALEKSLAEGAASANVEKGLLSSLGDKLSGLGKGAFGKNLLSGIGEGGALVALVALTREAAKLTEKVQGGNGALSEMGATLHDFVGELGSAITPEQTQEIWNLIEANETAVQNGEMTAQQFSQSIVSALGNMGVSAEQASNILKSAEFQMQHTSGTVQTLSADVQSLGTGFSETAGTIDLSSTNTISAFDGLHQALNELSNSNTLVHDNFTALDEAINNVQSTISVTPNSVGGAQEAFDALITTMEQLGIPTEDYISLVGQRFPEAVELAKTSSSGMEGAFKNISTEADNASAATSNIGETANNSIGNLVGFIMQAGFMAAGLASIQSSSEKADTGVSNLDTKISTFVAALSGYATGVYEKGKKTGENFPLGLSKGIENKLKNAKDSSGKVADAVNSAIKDKWQINSPSKVSEGFGENYGQGLINGINSKSYDIQTAMGNVIKKITSMFSETLYKNFHTYGRNLMVSFANGIASVDIPLPQITVSWNKYFLGNASFSTPRFSISYLARGGLITDEILARMGEGGKKEAVLPLENQKTMSMIADAIVKRMPQLEIGNIEINRSQAPYVTMDNLPRSTYSDSFGDDVRRNMAAISSNTFNNNENVAQAVRSALNGMAVVADGYIIGYLQEKNAESRNQNGGLGIFEV